MKRWLATSFHLALAGVVCLVLNAQAQLSVLGVGQGGQGGGSASYSGPGDIVSGARWLVGLRGYIAAFSGSVANLCDVVTGLVCANATWSAGVLTLPSIGGLTCNDTTNICNVATLYDQTGNTNCGGGPCDFTQTTNSKRPLLVVNGIGGKPSISCDGTSQTLGYSTANYSLAQPFTVSMVYKQNGASSNNIFAHEVNDIEITGGGTDQILMYAGMSVARAATNGSPFALQAIFNGASSSIELNGLQTPGNAGTAAPSSDRIFLCAFNNASFFWPGQFSEIGQWGAAFNGTQVTNMNANQRAYWGF